MPQAQEQWHPPDYFKPSVEEDSNGEWKPPDYFVANEEEKKPSVFNRVVSALSPAKRIHAGPEPKPLPALKDESIRDLRPGEVEDSNPRIAAANRLIDPGESKTKIAPQEDGVLSRFISGVTALPESVAHSVNAIGKEGAAALKSGDIHGAFKRVFSPLLGPSDVVNEALADKAFGKDVKLPSQEVAQKEGISQALGVVGLPGEEVIDAYKKGDYAKLAGMGLSAAALFKLGKAIHGHSGEPSSASTAADELPIRQSKEIPYRMGASTQAEHLTVPDSPPVRQNPPIKDIVKDFMDKNPNAKMDELDKFIQSTKTPATAEEALAGETPVRQTAKTPQEALSGERPINSRTSADIVNQAMREEAAKPENVTKLQALRDRFKQPPSADLPADFIQPGQEEAFNKVRQDRISKIFQGETSRFTPEDIAAGDVEAKRLIENTPQRNQENLPRDDWNPFKKTPVEETPLEFSTKPTATYIGEQEGVGPLFNIEGGLKDKSTVTLEGLKKEGIEVPEYETSNLSGAQRREKALAEKEGKTWTPPDYFKPNEEASSIKTPEAQTEVSNKKPVTIENAPPNQRAKMMRGEHEPVDILFSDSQDRELFGAGQSAFMGGMIKSGLMDRFKRASEGVAKKLGISEQESRGHIIEYNKEVRRLGSAVDKEGGNITAPSFKDFVEERNNSTEQPPPTDKSPSLADKTTSTLQSLEDAAKDRINKRGTFKGGRLLSGLPVDDLADFAVIGATKIARGLVKFADWSAEMIQHFGESIRPHLRDIFQAAQTKHDEFTDGAVKKLFNSLVEAKGAQGEQTIINKSEQAKRIAAFKGVKEEGVVGASKSLAAMKGEYEKVNPGEGLDLNQDESNLLFTTIKRSNKIDDFEKVRAYKTLFSLFNGDRVPQANELKLLDKVFAKHMKEVSGPGASGGYDIEGGTTNNFESLAITKGPSRTREIYDMTKGLISSDIPYMTSAAFRQGSGLTGTRNWFKAYTEQAKAFHSEELYNKIMKEVESSPIHKQIASLNPKNGKLELRSIADDIGLITSDLRDLSTRQEQIRSTLAERIPLYGRYIRANNRSFTAFINSLSTRTAEDWLNAAELIGKDGKITDMEEARKIAYTINELTGNGSYKVAKPFSRFTGSKKELDLTAASDTLRLIFNSPRLVLRDTRMMNPLNYIKNDKLVRMKYLGGAIRRAGVWAGFTGLSAMLGAKVSSDITSSDFGKARLGNTRFDAGTGLLQWMVLLGRQVLGESTSSVSGRTQELGSNITARTRFDVLEEFLKNKLHPSLRVPMSLLAASKNKPFHAISEGLEVALPIYTGDLLDLFKSDPDAKQIMLGLLATGTSLGAQTYGPKDYGRAKFEVPFDTSFKGGRVFNQNKDSRELRLRNLQ